MPQRCGLYMLCASQMLIAETHSDDLQLIDLETQLVRLRPVLNGMSSATCAVEDNISRLLDTCRFFPDGQFVYRTSPDVIRNAVRSLQLSPGKSKADGQVEKGIWGLSVGF